VDAPDLGRLLTRQRRIRPHPTLALEADCSLVEVAGEFHLPVHLDECVIRDVRHLRSLADLPIVVEYLYHVRWLAL